MARGYENMNDHTFYCVVLSPFLFKNLSNHVTWISYSQRTAPLHKKFELVPDHDWLVYYTWQTGIDELCNVVKYLINRFLWNRHTSFYYLILFFVSFFSSVDPLTERTIFESLGFRTDCGISVSQAKRTPPMSTPQIDRYVKINRRFWAISYCFVQIVMVITIWMHFVLLTTISLLFVWEGHLWIILKKGRGSNSSNMTVHYYGW